ncbi:hypothetical protein HCJ66_04745 [Listeria sp. FSL L7-1582]|uniref:hypothetical protein n=1 Tax=Listeria portnoyi TaxID=2713504 RepID=UPI00164D23BD|nr:hypothetical protein [Listeria portnoyi]MBC6308861.1 hypothetical protein [Listeria portnoyi]
MTIFKEIQKDFLTWKYIVIFVVMVAYAYYVRLILPLLQMESFFETVVTIVSDPYLFLYFIFPVWLFLFYKMLLTKKYPEYIIRWESSLSWALDIVRRSQVYTVCLVFLLLLAGISTSLTSVFSLYWRVDVTSVRSGEIIFSLMEFVNYPFLALMGQLIFYWIFFSITAFVLATCFAFFEKKWVISSVMLFLLLYMGIGFKLLPASWGIVNLSNYVFLYHSVASYPHLVVPLLVMIGVVTACTVLLMLFDRKSIRISSRCVPFILYVILVLLGLFLFPGISQASSLNEYVMMIFWGVSKEGFTMMSYSYYVIVFLGLLYLMLLRWEEIFEKQTYYRIIRHTGLIKWFVKFFRPYVVLVFGTMSGLLVVSYLAYFIMNGKWDVISFSISYQVVVNGFLQVLVYMLLLFIIYWYAGNINNTLAGLGIILAFVLPIFNIGYWMPFGLNSVGYLVEGLNIFMITLKLGIYVVVEFIIILCLLIKKDIKF